MKWQQIYFRDPIQSEGILLFHSLHNSRFRQSFFTKKRKKLVFYPPFPPVLTPKSIRKVLKWQQIYFTDPSKSQRILLIHSLHNLKFLKPFLSKRLQYGILPLISPHFSTPKSLEYCEYGQKYRNKYLERLTSTSAIKMPGSASR